MIFIKYNCSWSTLLNLILLSMTVGWKVMSKYTSSCEGMNPVEG